MKRLLPAFLLLLISGFQTISWAYSGSEPFILALQKQIRSHLNVSLLPLVPCYRPFTHITYQEALVRFVIQPSGDITNIELTQSSHYALFDQVAVNAVVKSNPLPVYFGAGTKKIGLIKSITLNFSDMYNLEPPAQNQKTMPMVCRIKILKF